MHLNILLLEDIHASATPILQGMEGANIVRLKHALSISELQTLLADVHVRGLRSRWRAYCTGINHLDLVAATELGVAVFNGPFSNTRSVAELVI